MNECFICLEIIGKELKFPLFYLFMEDPLDIFPTGSGQVSIYIPVLDMKSSDRMSGGAAAMAMKY